MGERRQKSRLSEGVLEDLIRQFVADATARIAADPVGVNRHTAKLYFLKLRELIALKLTETKPWLSGEIAVEESYTVAPGNGSADEARLDKVPVSGLLKKAAMDTLSLF